MNSPSFQEAALLEISKDKFSEEVEDYKIAILNLIIDRAHVNPSTYAYRESLKGDQSYFSSWNQEADYYAGRPAVDLILTREALTNIAEHGINYANSTDPVEKSGEGFAGTFVSYNDTFSYLRCIIETNGIQYVYTYHWEDGFASLINHLGEYSVFTCKEVAQHRLENILDQYKQPVTDHAWAYYEESAKKHGHT